MARKIIKTSSLRIANLTADSADHDFSTKFGLLLKKSRISCGLKPKQICEYVGISSTHLSEYENGTRDIPQNHIFSLANCLNIDPNLIMKISGFHR